MKSFEEQFPSLISKSKGIAGHYSFDMVDIQSHCLDKEKVRQAIKKIIWFDHGADCTSDCLYCQLIKELGL